MIKTCPFCREKFKTYRSAAIYCGRECQSKSQIKAKPRNCEFCKNEFTVPNSSRRGKLAFCSPDCHMTHKKTHKRVVNCRVCAKEFAHSVSHVFCCSLTCANKAKETFVTIECLECKDPFRSYFSAKSRMFCNNTCYLAHNRGENHPNFRVSKTTEFGKGKGWKELAKSIRKRDMFKCRWCKKHQSELRKTLDVHHVIARVKFTSYQKANVPSNLVSLCNSCHMKIENYITHGSLGKIPKRLRPPR